MVLITSFYMNPNKARYLLLSPLVNGFFLIRFAGIWDRNIKSDFNLTKFKRKTY